MIDILEMTAEDLRNYVHREIVKEACLWLGYDFDKQRIGRIGDASLKLMAEGVRFPDACAHALEEELLMHGDPCAPDLTGILR